MNTSKFVIATLAGGAAFFILGFLVYAVALEAFFTEHAGSATNIMKTEMEWWPLVLGNLSQAALFTYIFMKWANVQTFTGGFSAALVIGFLYSLGYGLISYDTTNFQDLTATIVNTIAYTLMSGLVGGIVGLVLGWGRVEGVKD